jgi:hypothetical protein
MIVGTAKQQNQCISSPGLQIHGASSPLVAWANSFQFMANGIVSPVVTTADAPSLATATYNAAEPNGSAVVVGNLAFDQGTVNVGSLCCQIYTLVATLPANDGSTVPTFSWLAGQAFTKYEYPSSAYIALPSQSNQAPVGFLYVKNVTAAVFIPGTTNLDAASLATAYLENTANIGAASVLASGTFFVGNGGNVATGVAMSGEATLANTGAVTLADSVKVYTTKVSLTTTQLKALHTTPVQLLAAPTAGTVYQILSVLGRINFVSAAYATHTALDIVDATTKNILFSDASTLLASASTVIAQIPALVNSASAPTANIITTAGAVQAYCTAGDPATGGGSVDVYVTYKKVTL